MTHHARWQEITHKAQFGFINYKERMSNCEEAKHKLASYRWTYGEIAKAIPLLKKCSGNHPNIINPQIKSHNHNIQILKIPGLFTIHL